MPDYILNILIVISPFFINPVFISLVIAFIASAVFYHRGSYARQTGHSFIGTLTNPGRLGEAMTYFHLRGFEKGGAKFLFNPYIPAKNGETSEIDVVMICRKGIFVFESKNYSGWIFGDEKNRYWYQTLPTGKGKKAHKEQFYNPIMQNRSHINHLRELTGEEIPFFSMIVFSDRCRLKNISVFSADTAVVNRKNIADTVKQMAAGCPDALTVRQIQRMYDRLLPYTRTDSRVKQQHIKDIEEKYRPARHAAGAVKKSLPHNRQTDDLICPLCAGRLVVRTASRGKNAGKKFYGCSNFPRCRYTREIDDSRQI